MTVRHITNQFGVAFALLAISAAAMAADVRNGGRIYAMHCAACHGADGRSVLPEAPNFARGERLLQPDLALLGSVRVGRGAMPGFMGLISDREILDVISFLRTMR